MSEEARPAQDALATGQYQAHGPPQYNRRIMRFLKDQLDKAERLEVPLHASAETLASFKERLKKGKRLLGKHVTFDIRNFYRTGETSEPIELLCEVLCEIVREWYPQGGIDIQYRLPKVDVEDDREDLIKLLRFVYKDEDRDVQDEVRDQWAAIKAAQKAISLPLEIVDEASLVTVRKLGQGGQAVVLEAAWTGGGRPAGGPNVAVKRPFKASEGDLPIEEFAQFQKEVIRHASLKVHPNIVALLATTTSGWIVMELADSDLRAACGGAEMLTWRTRVSLLRQGASGLLCLHMENLVHGDIKTPNFLLFGKGQDEPVLKVSDFGLSAEATESRSKSVRTGGGTPQWTAPESYDGKPVCQESDVYSFGMVMYEVITGKPPYGSGKVTQYAIMSKKLNGEEPCPVGPADCPSEALQLMRHCCAVSPPERPTMEEVCARLQALPTDWEPGTEQLSQGAASSRPAGLSAKGLPAANRVVAGGGVASACEQPGISTKEAPKGGLQQGLLVGQPAVRAAERPAVGAGTSGSHMPGRELQSAQEGDKTPLMLAAQGGQSGEVEELLSQGVDKDARDNDGKFYGDTAAAVARKANQMEIAELIKTWGRNN